MSAQEIDNGGLICHSRLDVEVELEYLLKTLQPLLVPLR